MRLLAMPSCTIAKIGDDFGKWRLVASSGKGPVSIKNESIESLFTWNRTDVGGVRIPELGVSLSIWNGDRVKFRCTIGSASHVISNHAVLYVRIPTSEVSDWFRPIVEAMVTAFDPERATATSNELMEQHRATDPASCGWVTYTRADGLREHQELLAKH